MDKKMRGIYETRCFINIANLVDEHGWLGGTDDVEHNGIRTIAIDVYFGFFELDIFAPNLPLFRYCFKFKVTFFRDKVRSHLGFDARAGLRALDKDRPNAKPIVYELY